MPRSDSERLAHMLEAAQKATSLIEGLTLPDLERDEVRTLALTHLLEILGEASKAVSGQTRTEYPGIPWGQLAATRDRLIHGYFSIDLEIVWKIVTEDLPPVIELLENAVERD